MSEVISSFRGLRYGSQVFALLMLFLCVIVHTIDVHIALWYVVLSAISMMFVKIRLAVRMLVGMVV